MHDVGQCGHCWSDEFQFSDSDFKLGNALVLLRRRLAELLLQSLSSFLIVSFRLKLLLLVASLELQQFIDIDTIRQLGRFLGCTQLCNQLLILSLKRLNATLQRFSLTSCRRLLVLDFIRHEQPAGSNTDQGYHFSRLAQ